MPSFDIVSELNLQEIDNAVNQATKEISTRFDFRGTGSEIVFDKVTKTIKLSSNHEDKIEGMIGVLQSKAIKRGIDIRCLKKNKIEAATGKTLRCTVTLVEGIDKENGKKINSFIKDLEIKVQSAIHDDKIRVTGKKRDDLQNVIQSLKGENFECPLQFNNFRE